jgi:O-antigen ligase
MKEYQQKYWGLGLQFLGTRQGLCYILEWLERSCLAVLLIALPFRYRYTLVERPNPPIYSDYIYVLIHISDVFLSLLLVFWLARRVLERRKPGFGPRFLSLPLAGLIGIGLVTVPFSVDPFLSFYHSLRLALLAGFALFILNEVRSLEAIILPVAGQVLIQATVGVVQVLQQSSLGLGRLGELELDPAWSGVSIVWAEGVRSLRAYGLSEHPNILGGSLAFGLILLAGWYGLNHTRRQALVVGTFFLGSLALLLTFSRSAWLAMAFGFGLLVVWLWRAGHKDSARAGLWLVAACLVVMLPFIWQNAGLIGVRLNRDASFTNVPQENQAIGERALLVEASNRIFINRPFTGSGLAASPVAMKEAFPDFPVHYQPAHFVLIVAAAETGMFGALFYSIAMFAPWAAIWLNRAKLHFSPELIAASCLLAAVTIVGFFDYYTWLWPAGRLWQWFAWGLWGSVYLASLGKRHYE